ncbi:MAG: extracellular solute-binding protein [bacterium]
MLRQSLVISFLFLLCAGLLFAGGQQESAKGPDVITVMTWPDECETPLSERPIIQYLEETLNVKIEWKMFPHAERGTVIPLMIAAGGEMPDLFPSFISQDTSYSELEEKGVIIAWSDFMEAGDMPLTVAKLNKPENAGVKNQLTDLDTGKIYGLPPFSPTSLLLWTDYIRGDWLEAFGMEIPGTVEEYRDYLRAVKTRDPNGNGLADEVPWQNFYSGVSWISQFVRMFGLVWPDYSWSTFGHMYWAVVDSERVVFAPTDERYKAMLQYLNSLWKEGLINQEQFNMDSPKFNASVSNNTLGAQQMWPSAIVGMTENLRKLDPEAVWLPIPYPIDTRYTQPGERKYAFRGPVSFTWLLSAKGKNTEAAVRLAEFVFGNEEFQFTTEFGLEGVHHVIGEDGFPVFIGEWADMTTTDREAALGSGCGRLMVELPEANMIRRIETDPIFKEYKEYLAKITVNPAPMWFMNEQQQALKTDVANAIYTYIDENIMNFIIGNRPFSEWDEYVETINKEAGDKIEAARKEFQQYFDKNIKSMY